MSDTRTEVAFQERGTGRPVVFLHGQPGRGSFWTPVVDALPRGIRAILVDRLGYGDTAADAGGLRGNAIALTRLLDRLELSSATLVGHSWGGGVALATAEEHPDRVDGLVLVGSIGVEASVDRLDRLLARPRFGPAITFAAFQVLGRLLPHRRVAGRLAPVGNLSPATVRELVASWRGGRDWRSFVVEQRAMVREIGGVDADLESVRAPTIVLEGTEDRIAGPRTGAPLAARLDDAALRTVSGAGHLLPLEAPQEVARAVAAVCATPRPGVPGGAAGSR